MRKSSNLDLARQLFGTENASFSHLNHNITCSILERQKSDNRPNLCSLTFSQTVVEAYRPLKNILGIFFLEMQDIVVSIYVVKIQFYFIFTCLSPDPGKAKNMSGFDSRLCIQFCCETVGLFS